MIDEFNELRSGMIKRQIALVILIACVVIYFSPVVFAQKHFPSDGQLAAYYQGFQFWSNDWAVGWPIISDPVSMPLYPIKFLMNGLGFSFNIFIVAAYVISVVGMYFFLLSFLNIGAASFGALTYALSGWMQVHLGHTSMIHTAAWLPWMMWGAAIIISKPSSVSGRGIFLLAISVSMSFLAGHLQITIYSMILLYAFSICKIIKNRCWKKISQIFIGTLLGFALAAPALFGTMELLRYTYRSKLSADDIFSYSIPFSGILDFFIPLLQGATPYGWFGVGLSDPNYPQETLSFFPAMLLVFLLFAIFVKNVKHQVYFWGGAGGMALVLATGNAFPYIAKITEYVFPLNMFRAPGRHMLEVSFCFSVLAAIGMQSGAEDGEHERRSRFVIFVYILITTLSVVYAIANYESMKLSLSAIWPPILLAILMAALSISLVMVRFDSKSVTFPIAAIGVVLLQTLAIGYQLPWKVYASTQKDLAEPLWVTDFKSKLGNDFRVLGANGWQSRVFNPDESRLHGMRTFGWYGPLIDKRLAEISGLTSGGWIQRWVFDKNNTVLDLFSVRYVSIPDDEKDLLNSKPERWAYIKTYGNEHIYENLNALPRARIVCNVSPIADQDSLNIFILNEKSILNHAFINMSSGFQTKNSEQCSGRIKIVKENADIIQIKAELVSDRVMLVVSDLWYPGWSVLVNDRSQEIYRINSVSRGILLEKGNSVVHFSYNPTYWIFSCIVSALAVLILMLLPMVNVCRLFFRGQDEA